MAQTPHAAHPESQVDAVFGDLLMALQSAAVWLILAALRAGWWALSHPVALINVTALGWASWRAGWPAAVAAVGVEVAVLLAWQLAHPRSLRRWVIGPVRRRWRGWVIYLRHWQAGMVLCGLSATLDGTGSVPKLVRVRCDPFADHVLVRMLKGQPVAQWERTADALASTFGAGSCKVRVERPGRVWLDFIHADSLAAPIAPFDIPASVDVEGVPVGVCEDGRVWWIRLLGTHLLIAGATGSGKGSVLWSLLRGVAPAIRAGLVRVWAADPKGGMELGFGAPLFTRFAAESPTAMVSMLEDAVAEMDRRVRRLAGRTRRHDPTVDEPLILVVVDELASLTAYEPDRKLRERANTALAALLTKGRAAAVVVVAAVQDPRKDVVAFRHLFPTRVALRLDTPAAVDMVLGDDMHQAGARADQIPESTPGVGYVKVDEHREPVRVRATWVDDYHIHELAADYPAPPDPAEPASPPAPDLDEVA